MADDSMLKAVAFGDLQNELATTRRVLERVPDEHLGWKPHEKSFSLGTLAAHIVNLVGWGKDILELDGLDLSGPVTQSLKGSVPREELLRALDANIANVTQALERATTESLGKTWTLRHGDHVILSAPRAGVLRGMGVSHMVHHRAQLAVYFRLLNVPVPPMYGPTADEQM
jgi:uncharacterized damage-inducible protein DinB